LNLSGGLSVRRHPTKKVWIARKLDDQVDALSQASDEIIDM
jgi:hypothetical protein